MNGGAVICVPQSGHVRATERQPVPLVDHDHIHRSVIDRPGLAPVRSDGGGARRPHLAGVTTRETTLATSAVKTTAPASTGRPATGAAICPMVNDSRCRRSAPRPSTISG
jgi:hypothetical protein